jgi:hypothetical protein
MASPIGGGEGGTSASCGTVHPAITSKLTSTIREMMKRFIDIHLVFVIGIIKQKIPYHI